MPKPQTLKDLLVAGHITKSEVRAIARSIFNGETQGAGPEGYLITSASFDDLPEGTKQHIVKAVLEFKIENVFDYGEKVEPDDGRTDLEKRADNEAEAARENTGLSKGDFGDGTEDE